MNGNMSARTARITVPAVCILALSLLAGPADSATITVDSPSTPAQTLGDFQWSGANTAAVTQKPVAEMLRLNRDGTSSDTHDISVLWTALSDAGLTSTRWLTFSFHLNDKDKASPDIATISALTLTFERPVSLGGGTLAYDLDLPGSDNAVIVEDFADNNAKDTQGRGGAEAQFSLYLPFDFMTAYNAGSTEQFSLSMTIADTSNGPDYVQLSAGLTAATVPEPSTLTLVAVGLLGCLAQRRRSRAR